MITIHAVSKSYQREYAALDVYLEYTGTAWRVILQHNSTLPASATCKQVRAQYQARFDLRWLQPWPAFLATVRRLSTADRQDGSRVHHGWL